MFDFVRPALWAGGLALIILLLCSAYVVLANAGSRNLGLGLGALFGACIIFAVQLWFELQSTQTITDFPAQFVVDFKDKSIRKHPVVLSEGVGAFVNQEANALMAGANPSFNSDQAHAITRDLAIIYLVTYLIHRQFDWQLDTASYKVTQGTMTTFVGASGPGECAKVEHTYILDKLRKAGNVFASPPHALWFLPLCLPPSTTFDLSSRSVTLTSPVCEIFFSFQGEFLEKQSSLPDFGAQQVLLPDGSPRYESVTHGIRATVTYFALRAQDRKIKAYQAWAARVVEGVKALFELCRLNIQATLLATSAV